MSKLSIGIDLGTTNSTVCVFDNGEPRLLGDAKSTRSRRELIPSLVAENTDGKIVVGELAKSYTGQCIREAKREIGVKDYDKKKYNKLPNHSLSPIMVSQLILRKLVSIVEDSYPGNKVEEAVITVPANFNDAEKNATKDAANLAGINTVHLIAEPTAAYLAYGHFAASKEEIAFVFDFGGGTLDISIVETMESVAESRGVGGDKNLGGKDIDEAFMSFIKSKFDAEHPDAEIQDGKSEALKEAAESVKKKLSSVESSKIFIANFAKVGGELRNLQQDITRSEFEDSISEILAKAKACVREALKTCNMKPSEVNTVLLVGGSSHIPCIRELVLGTFGSKEALDLDADCAVAQGASIRHAMLNDQLNAKDGLVLMDISRYGFGVETIDLVGGYWQQGRYSALMDPQTHFPYEAVHEFSLVHEEQEEVEISVFQSDQKGTLAVSDAISTGVSGRIENIPHSKLGHPHQLKVTISVDENNLISVTSTIPETGQILPLIIDDYSDRLSGKQRMELEKKLSDINYADVEQESALKKINPDGVPFVGSEIGQESAPLVKKAMENLENGGLPEYAERLNTLIKELVNALENGNDKVAALYRDKLTDLLFDIEEAQ